MEVFERTRSLYARELHATAIVVDAHTDVLERAYREGRDLGRRSSSGHVDIPRMREGGVDVEFMALYPYLDPDVLRFRPYGALMNVLRLAGLAFREFYENASDLVLVRSVDDLYRAVDAGKIGCILTIEGAEALEGELELLTVFYELGIRVITITHNRRNQMADGVGESRTRGGLTNLGVELVRRMNRMGMIIDVAHLSPAGFWDVLEVTRDPVIASHTNAYALCNHPRNLSDSQMKAIADNMGAIGVCFYPDFLCEGEATVEDVLDHIDYIVEVAGIDHVGIGSDFDGIDSTPRGLEDISKLGRITEGLVRRGYSDQDILKILGGNFLRVFEQVCGRTQTFPEGGGQRS